jgi:hypothetical protein
MQSNVVKKQVIASPVTEGKQNSIKEALTTVPAAATQKAADKDKANANTNDKPDDKDKQGNARFKHFIRIKIGGDSTGTLPTTVDNKADATSADTKPLAASPSQDKKVDGTTNDKNKQAQANNPNVAVPDFLKNPAKNTTNQTPVNTTQKTDSSKVKDATTTAPSPQNKSNTTAPGSSPNPATQATSADKSNATAQATSSDKKDKDKEEPETPRELIFDSRLGQIVGRSEVRLSTTNHSMVKVTIIDPKGEYRSQIAKLKNVEVSIGFVNGKEKNVFTGVIWSIGVTRSGTLIEAIDPSAQMQAATSTVTETANPAIAPPQTVSGTATNATPGSPTQQQVAGTNPATGTNTAQPANTATTPQANTGTQPNTTATPQPNTTTAPALTPARPTTPTTPATNASAKVDQTKAALSANEKDILTQMQTAAPATKSGSLAKNFIESAGSIHGLKFADQTSGTVIHKMGQAQIQQSLMEAAVRDAALRGNVLVTRGNTVTEVSPGNAASSGVILDYASNPAAFLGRPTIKKRSPVQLQSNSGGVMVRGWNPATKQEVMGVAYTPSQPTQHPTGIIQPPEWSSIKLSDPIIPGSMYTWADATRNGSRVPEGKDVIQGFIRIATIVTQLTAKVGKGKWTITSWYRPRSVNERTPGAAKDSRHIYGDAIDFYYEGCFAFHKEMYDSWKGGLAIKPGAFVHLDNRDAVGRGQARWTYG